MRLLRLELFGFKSFKDKTILTFDQPITAIIGSNGCGKSNVVDALYWVMGDMSPKHLRGHHMSDVIFSGSKDAAALDMAEVTLVMSRDPLVDPELPPHLQAANEIQITRRYYRSGDSEYFMNKAPCRLRDIQEFFMDTGLGAKAYSIIEQGAITRLVAQKPEERRTVIEEVAGVMKFKARKAETIRKIEGTTANLERVDDILKELQKQLGGLKRQADRAEKYKSFSEELRGLEVRMAAREWRDRSENHSQSLVVQAELRRMVESLGLKSQEERENLQNLQQELSLSESTLDQSRSQHQDLELQLRESAGRTKTFETKLSSIQERISKDQLDQENLEVRSRELEASLETLIQEINTLSQETLENQSVLETLELRALELQEQSTQLRSESQSLNQEVHALQIEATKSQQAVENAQKQSARIQAREEEIREQIEQIALETESKSQDRSVTLTALDQAFATRADLESSQKNLAESLSQMETEIHDLREQKTLLMTEKTEVAVKRAHLEQLEASFEGVQAASKELGLHLRQAGQENPLLLQQIQAPKDLERLLENLLQNHLHRVPLTKASDAEALRDYLKTSENGDARKSRPGFWIQPETFHHDGNVDLDTVFVSFQTESFEEVDGLIQQKTQTQVRTAREFLAQSPDVIGSLEDLLNQAGLNLENAPWMHLVAGTFVVRSRQALFEIAKTLHGLPIRLVSLDGDTLDEKGILDLAPVEVSENEQASGLVRRRREIEELKAIESDAQARLSLAEETLALKQRQHHEAREALRELAMRLSSLDPDVERHTSFLRQVEAQLARLQGTESLLKAELIKIETQQAEFAAQIQEFESKLEALNLDIQNKTQEASVAAETLNSVVEEANTLQAKVSDERRELQKREKALAERQSQRAAWEQELRLSTARREHLAQDIQNLQNEIEILVQELSEAKTNEESLRNDVEVAQATLANAQVRYEEQKDLVRQTQSSVDRVSQELANLKSRLAEVEQGLAINDVELKNLSERMKEQFQIELEALSEAQLQEIMAPQDMEEISDPAFARARIQQLKEKIDNLGKINMLAAEEFSDLSKRYEYLFIQREDVHESLRQLQDALEKINRESTERFAEAFHAVNQAFQSTFPVLFGGGFAELRLTNPDDLLESGVEIVAQPPGKKLQSITLLSGGEKALTAVSLIFGIFSIKPSPFCVLDEVDAPLDDANVGRFNVQLRRMADTSQILLISHRKRTMESCDAVFGVTMEQPGISKVASAKLKEMVH